MAQDDGALFNVWVLAKTGFEPGVAREICADCDENCSNKGLLVTLSRSVCVCGLCGGWTTHSVALELHQLLQCSSYTVVHRLCCFVPARCSPAMLSGCQV